MKPSIPHPLRVAAVTTPAVGIFWCVGEVLVIDRSTLDQAETYGDCITLAAGHYERWPEWQALGTARLVAKLYPGCSSSTEYDEWPSGRVVFETPAPHASAPIAALEPHRRCP